MKKFITAYQYIQHTLNTYLNVNLPPWLSPIAWVSSFQQEFCVQADLYFGWLSSGLHPCGCIDSVTKKTVSWHLVANHTGNNVACIISKANVNLAATRPENGFLNLSTWMKANSYFKIKLELLEFHLFCWLYKGLERMKELLLV